MSVQQFLEFVIRRGPYDAIQPIQEQLADTFYVSLPAPVRRNYPRGRTVRQLQDIIRRINRNAPAQEVIRNARLHGVYSMWRNPPPAVPMAQPRPNPPLQCNVCGWTHSRGGSSKTWPKEFFQ